MTTPFTGTLVPANNWIITPPANAYVNANGEVVVDLSGEPGGPVVATTLSASGAVQFDSTLNVDGATTTHALAATGAISATTTIAAGTTVTAGTGFVATTGGVTASAGNIVATLGNITASAGNIAATLGSVTAGTTVTAGTGLTVSSGAVTTTGATQVGLTDALTLRVDLATAPPDVFYVVSPWSGTIVAIHAIIDRALTTGNAVLTGNIAATPITNGVVTCVQAGSAPGSVFSATPTDANTVVAGVSKINFVRTGTNDADSIATITVLIRRSA